MKTEKIYFTIKCEEQEIDFCNEYDEDGNCIDNYSRNPNTGWTNYNAWNQGWSEQDDETNEIWAAIKDYSRSYDLHELVSSFTKEDIGRNYGQEYYCDANVNENKTYSFTVTCTDIEIEE